MVIAIGRVQRIPRVVFIRGIERVVGNVPIRWIGRVVRIVPVPKVGGIIGRGVLLCGVQRIVRRKQFGWINDVGVAFGFLMEAGFGKRRNGEEEATEEPDHPHGEPLS